MQTDDEILGEIKTPNYSAKCTAHSITINWNNNVDEYYEPDIDCVRNRIFEYSSEEIIFYYKKDLHYVNMKGDKKVILKNVDGANIFYYKKFGKLVVVEDGGDPPDNIFIYLIEDLLKSPADMNIKTDRLKYHIISFSEWDSRIYHDDKYIYVSTDDELTKINVNTYEITRIA